MGSQILFLVFLVAVFVSWFVTRALIPLLKGRVMDVPNERSSHEAPTPRGGGIAIVFVVSLVAARAVLMGQLSEGVGVVMFGALTIAMVGLADDFQGGLKVGIRFLIQAAVAAIVVLIVGPLGALPFPAPANVALAPWLGWLVTLGWILGVTNIFNFLDGIDGFAGLQAVIAGLALGWVLAPGSVASMIALAAAGGSLGFLFHNWHPARIFMGDVGSLFLGFLFATLPLAAPREAVGPAVFVAGMALWFFLADGTFTIFRRLVRRERVWEAHRSHLYQRLVQAGWGHARVASVVMFGGAFVAALAAWSVRGGDTSTQWSVLVAGVVCFLVLVVGVEISERRKG